MNCLVDADTYRTPSTPVLRLALLSSHLCPPGNPMSAPQSIADSVLGLTQSELLAFRHQQQIYAQRSHQGGGMADRGRGQSRVSNSSSRAVSAASSQQSVPGRILLDPSSLQGLYAHLESVMRGIQRRIAEVRLPQTPRLFLG
jgi:hypothetical protein